MKTQTIRIKKEIITSQVFKNPKAMQLLWFILLSADKKEGKLKTTQAQITETTGLSASATEKSIEMLKNEGYISKRKAGDNISIQVKNDFPYIAKGKTQDFIKLDSNIVHFDWLHEVPAKHLWIYLLMKANTEPQQLNKTVIGTGILIATVSGLAASTGLTISQIRTALDKLSGNNLIEVKTTNKFTIIRINNYDVYQK